MKEVCYTEEQKINDLGVKKWKNRYEMETGI